MLEIKRILQRELRDNEISIKRMEGKRYRVKVLRASFDFTPLGHLGMFESVKHFRNPDYCQAVINLS